MIVQVEGSETRLSICQTRRILKGTVYCGEETYELNGKERTYKSYRPLGKHVPKPGCEAEFAEYLARKKVPPRKLCMLVPCDPEFNPNKNKQTPEVPGGVLANVARVVPDSRRPYLVHYPLWIVLMVVFMAAASGVLTAVQIAHYWAANRKKFEQIFGAAFPKRNISHDTVRRLLMQLDATAEGRYLRQLFRVVMGICLGVWRSHLLALDGQAARSSKTHNGFPHYTLTVVDCDLRIACDQVQVGEKTNEIPHAVEVLEALDLSDCVVVADALHCQHNLVNKIVDKGGDYCISVKESSVSKALYAEAEAVVEVALSERNLTEQTIPVKSRSTHDDGHGRIETRDYYAIPGSWFDEARNWTALSEGTIFVVKTRKTYKATSTGKQERTETSERYFATSFSFDHPRLMDIGIRAIRQRWGIESMHWEIDVQMRQDLVQMSNVRYIRVQRMLSRIGLGIIRYMQMEFEKEHGTDKPCPSVESMMIHARDPEVLMHIFEGMSENGRLQELLEQEA